MMSRKEAVTVYQTVGIEIWKAHQAEVAAATEQTGQMILPSADPRYAKLLHKEAKRSRSVRDAIRPPMLALCESIRDSPTHPLVAMMGYDQALTTLRLLAISKYGEGDEIELLVAELTEGMPQMLGLRL